MSDDDRSSGMIGSLISLVLLIVLWPYILAAFGLFIAYLLLAALLDWVGSHFLMTALWVAGVLGVYLIFKLHLIGRAIRWIANRFHRCQVKKEWTAVDELIEEESTNPESRKFIPSTNLYCYWCTKKLGVKSWEKDGKYYCQSCYEKILGVVDQV
jgi:hypothetical protein